MTFKGIYLIGLTGNIACGKSTVVEMLRELGAHVIDADRVTHELQRPGEEVYARIVEAFGADILVEPGGPIDRRRLGAIVFSDPAALRRLEQIVHPAAHARILSWLEEIARHADDSGVKQDDTVTRWQGDKVTENVSTDPATSSPPHLVTPSPVAVIDAIKLLEAGWRPLCDAIWVVTCAPSQQLARLMATRGMGEDEARARVAAQPPQADKVAQADVVIDNSGALTETWRQAEAAYRSLL